MNVVKNNYVYCLTFELKKIFLVTCLYQTHHKVQKEN